MYGAIGSTWDISDAVNTAVAADDGEAVVALTLENKGCALNWIFPLTLLPFWPGCQNGDIHAFIVRRKATPEPDGKQASTDAPGKRP